MEDKDHSFYFEVVCCFHPTDYDPVGRDGLYVKSVAKIEDPATLRARITEYEDCIKANIEVGKLNADLQIRLAELEATMERVNILEARWRGEIDTYMTDFTLKRIAALSVAVNELAAALRKK